MVLHISVVFRLEAECHNFVIMDGLTSNFGYNISYSSSVGLEE